MKITDPNRCVRQCRDEEQIARCRARVGEWTAETERMAAVLRLAANPVRLSVLRLLWEEGRLCVCDLSEILGMSIPAVSQHLKKLREGGLVEVE
ncbi:MAG: transcriptional regulator, partial [Bacteroidetes bacterium]